jgi:hypothetical protein
VPSATFTTMGWEVYPHGLNLLLEELSRTYRPECLLITENGADFEDSWNGNRRISDPQRIVYLREHLQAVACALHHGVPVGGQCGVHRTSIVYIPVNGHIGRSASSLSLKWDGNPHPGFFDMAACALRWN